MSNRRHLQVVHRSTTAIEDIPQLAELGTPNYGTYPSVLEFAPGIGPQHTLDEIHRTNQEPIPAPLSIYLHLPFWAVADSHGGGDRVVSRGRRRDGRYLELLSREIELSAAPFDSDRPVIQLHFGGRATNSLRPDELAQLIHEMRRCLSIAPDCEISMEVDPCQYQSGDAPIWAALGFNRLSLGVHDLDPSNQHAINRVRAAGMVAETVAEAREAGIRRIGFDLIHGQSKPTRKGASSVLGLVEQLRPERVIASACTHMPLRICEKQAQVRLPEGSTHLEIQHRYARELGALGYRHIGLGHFAVPEDELSRALADGSLLRNIHGYSTHAGGDIIGLGLSAVSSIGRLYTRNHTVLRSYAQAITAGRLPTALGHLRSDDDLLRFAIMQKIICRQRLEFAEFVPDGAFAQGFANDLDRLRQLDPTGALMHITSSSLIIRPAGEHALHQIAHCFDRYAHDRDSDELARAV